MVLTRGVGSRACSDSWSAIDVPYGTRSNPEETVSTVRIGIGHPPRNVQVVGRRFATLRWRV